MTSLTLYTDGGSRGNPGQAASGYVFYRGDSVIASEGFPLGETTNNVAEYMAVIRAFTWLASNRETVGECSGIDVRMDSLLICQQLKGVYKITKPHLYELFKKARGLIESMGVPVTLTHVLREKNKAADSLVNQALDRGEAVSLE